MKAKRKAMREAEAQARYRHHQLGPWVHKGQTATNNCSLCKAWPVVVKVAPGKPSNTKPEYPRGKDTRCPTGLHAAAKAATGGARKAG